VIPRADYEIVEDSWNVLGLEGTGSKDVRMTDVFIPDYRVVEAATMLAGGYEHRQEGKALYRLKFPLVFSAAIAAGTQGIAQGALAVYRDYLAGRVSADGTVGRTDPTQLVVYGEAAADIAASRSHLLTSTAEIFDFVSKGGELTRTQRLTFRRDQVRGTRRCAEAIDRLYRISGAAGIRKDFPNGRYWRDLQAGLSHICNVAENIHTGWSTDNLGDEASPALFV
jgi:alkylation response protein AidB-like acyl-CoA dehydrogenase